MTKWSVVLFALMMIVGCGGGGGGGTSGGSGGGGEECVALELPDDFERATELLSTNCSGAWLSTEDYGDYYDFQVLDGKAKPTSPGINANIWNEEFDASQEVIFTIKEIPTVPDESSLGVMLRINLATGSGYLVTFVPQTAGATDVIRVWNVVNGVLSEEGTPVDEIELNEGIYNEAKFNEGDRFRVYAENTSICVQIYSDSNRFEDIGCVGNLNEQNGYIGIYAAHDSGALDDFGGGSLVLK